MGRSEELRAVLGGLSNAEAGSGSCWLVTGPAGIGKSRLLRRAEELARERGFGIAHGYALEGGLASMLPFRMVQKELQAACRLPMATGVEVGGVAAAGSAGVPHRVGSRRHLADRNLPGVRPSGDDSGAGGNLPVSIDSTILSLVDALEEACQSRAQLVLLDDIQFADAESLRCLRLLVAKARTLPVVILAAAQGEGDSWHQTGVGRALLDLRRGGQTRWIQLPPLSEEASVELVANVLGQPRTNPAQTERFRQVARLVGGTPYFLVEFVTTYPFACVGTVSSPFGSVNPSASTAGEGGQSLEVPMPIQESILRRVRELDPADRELVLSAALIGFEFDAEALAVVLGRPAARTLSATLRLARKGWPLRLVSAPRQSFSFEHSLLWRTLASEVDRGNSRSQLQRLADWWATHRSSDPVTEAQLRLRIGDRLEAAQSLQRALGTALREGAIRSVEELLRWGWAELRDDTASSLALAEVTITTAERLREQWHLGSALAILREPSLADAPVDVRRRAAALRIEALLVPDIKEASALLSRLEQEIREDSGAGGAKARTSLAYLKGLVLGYTGPAAPAHRAIAVALAGRRGRLRPYERFRLLLMDALVFSNEGRWPEARARISDTRRALVRAGNLPALREQVRGAQAHLEFRAGHVRRAVALATRIAQTARASRNALLEGNALVQRAMFRFAVRDLSGSRQDLDRAEVLLTKLDVSTRVPALRVLRGWTYAIAGEWANAREEFDAVSSDPGATTWPRVAWAAKVGRALVTAETGDPGTAFAELPKPESLPVRSTSYVLEYHCARARILELVGKDREARRSILDAQRVSNSTGGTWTDRLESAVQLARWERNHGRAPARRAAQQAAERLAGRYAISLRRWEPIGRDTPPQGPGGRPDTGSSEPTLPATDRLAEQILELMARPDIQRRPVNALGMGLGWSERELAERLGVARDRFSRALGRLRLSGLVDRESARPPHGARRVFLYRLTQRGALRRS